jgi:hypothetical protein
MPPSERLPIIGPEERVAFNLNKWRITDDSRQEKKD